METQDGSVPAAAATTAPGQPGAAGQPPERLLAGRYLLGERLGRGGMGTVWRAQDQMLDREVAVKELSVHHLAEEDLAILQSRMKQEARAAARIKHPGVITIHDVLEQDGRPWIVMELIDGRSLADVIAQDGTLQPRDAAGVGVQVLAALHRGHQLGVLHRDVKPANVLLERGTGRVVLTDFGIATFEGSSTLTRPGDLVGSPDYLAPERAQGHRPGPESDLWALGATLYAAVEGDSPFRRSSPLSTLAAVVGDPLPEPRRAGALTPVLRGLMEKDPKARPTADDAMLMLQDVAAGHTMGISRAAPVQRTPTQVVPVVDRNDDSLPDQRTASTPHTPQSPQTPQTPKTPQTPQALYTPLTAPAFPRQPTAGTGTGTAGPARPHAPYPSPEQYPPAEVRIAPQTPPRRRRHGAAIAVAGLVAGVLAVGVGYVAFNRDKGGSTRGTVAVSHTPAAKQPGRPSTGGDAGTLSPSDGATPSQAGYTWTEDAGGFGFLLPSEQNWARSVSQGSNINYTPDDGAHLLRFAVTTGQTLTPLAHAQQMEQQSVHLSRNYLKLQMVANRYKGCPGAVWEFTWDSETGPRHAIEQLYRDEQGTEYAIYLSYPEADWKTGQQRFTTVLNSFQPTGSR